MEIETKRHWYRSPRFTISSKGKKKRSPPREKERLDESRARSLGSCHWKITDVGSHSRPVSAGYVTIAGDESKRRATLVTLKIVSLLSTPLTGTRYSTKREATSQRWSVRRRKILRVVSHESWSESRGSCDDAFQAAPGRSWRLSLPWEEL